MKLVFQFFLFLVLTASGHCRSFSLELYVTEDASGTQVHVNMPLKEETEILSLEDAIGYIRDAPFSRGATRIGILVSNGVQEDLGGLLRIILDNPNVELSYFERGISGNMLRERLLKTATHNE